MEEKRKIDHDEKQEYELFGTLLKSNINKTILVSPLNKNCSTYIYIDYPEEYEKVVKFTVTDDEDNEYINPPLEISDGGDKFIHIMAKADPNENYVMTFISYRIPNYVYGWCTAGSIIGAIGIVAIPIIYLLYPKDGTFLGIIITWSIFTITAVTIIKGWLFTKTWNDKVLKIHDWFYRRIAILMTIESLAILFAYSLWH